MVNPFFGGKAPKKKDISAWAGRDRFPFRLIEVRDDVNSFLGDSHLDVFGLLGMAKGNPSGGILESSDRTNTSKDEPHHAADEMAVAPAGGLERGPEVAVETSFARLTVIEEKAVGAGHPIVVKIMNDRNFEIKSSLIYRWGKARKGILNDP